MSNTTSFSAATPLTAVPASLRTVDSLRDRGVERLVAQPVRFGNVGGFGPAVPSSIHNSITPMGAAPASTMAGHRAYAAKQAAPPRGRHR